MFLSSVIKFCFPAECDPAQPVSAQILCAGAEQARLGVDGGRGGVPAEGCGAAAAAAPPAAPGQPLPQPGHQALPPPRVSANQYGSL